MTRSKIIGRLTALSALFVGVAANATHAVFLYGVDIGANRLVKIDSANGTTTSVGFLTVGGGGLSPFNGLGYDLTGDRFIGVNPGFSQIFAIDRYNAATTLIGPTATYGHDNENGLAVDSAHGTAFISTNNLNRLLTVRLSDGVPVSTVTITGAHEVEGLGYDSSTDALYGISQLDSRVVTINRNTGVATPLPTALPSAVWRGLEFDPSSRQLYASAITANGSDLYSINPTSGAATRIGAISGSVQSLAIVPETGIALAFAAMAPLTMRRRRALS